MKFVAGRLSDHYAAVVASLCSVFPSCHLLKLQHNQALAFPPFSLNWVNSGRDSWGEAPLAASADVLNQKHCFALHKLVRMRASQPCFTLLPCLPFNDHIKIRKRFDFICFLSIYRVKPFVIILWDAVDIKVSWKEIKKIHKILFALSVLS